MDAKLNMESQEQHLLKANVVHHSCFSDAGKLTTRKMK